LALVLGRLKPPDDPRLLVGTSTADDAGVFLLREGLALVQTVDMLTPMTEDPYAFGRIAAANSLSDIYAMGGEPLTALNIVGFPAPAPADWLAEILRGAQDTAEEAGTVIVGGHTFNEKEIKFGMAVTGTIAPDRIVTNAGARPGDALVLTKPLGCGIFTQQVLSETGPDPELAAAAVSSMMALNREASRAMLRHGVHSATDITGYGLLGHAQEMAEGSGVRLRFRLGDLPFLPRVRELAAQGLVDSGVAMNRQAFEERVVFADGIAGPDRDLLFGSETSGGLLIALAPERAGAMVEELRAVGVEACLVGGVTDGPAGTVETGGQ